MFNSEERRLVLSLIRRKRKPPGSWITCAGNLHRAAVTVKAMVGQFASDVATGSLPPRHRREWAGNNAQRDLSRDDPPRTGAARSVQFNEVEYARPLSHGRTLKFFSKRHEARWPLPHRWAKQLTGTPRERAKRKKATTAESGAIDFSPLHPSWFCLSPNRKGRAAGQ